MPVTRSGAISASIGEDEPLPPCHDRSPCSSSGGHERVLAELYSQEKGGLLRFLSKRSDQQSAEDMLHQLFVKLASRNISDIGAPRAYLFEAARNLLSDHGRSIERRGQAQFVPADDTNVVASDPVALLEARDRLNRLEDAMRSLKPFTREIFLACRIDGYSYREIADRTGLSVRGVEKQMSRAIKHLGRHLQRHG